MDTIEIMSMLQSAKSARLNQIMHLCTLGKQSPFFFNTIKGSCFRSRDNHDVQSTACSLQPCKNEHINNCRLTHRNELGLCCGLLPLASKRAAIQRLSQPYALSVWQWNSTVHLHIWKRKYTWLEMGLEMGCLNRRVAAERQTESETAQHNTHTKSKDTEGWPGQSTSCQKADRQVLFPSRNSYQPKQIGLTSSEEFDNIIFEIFHAKPQNTSQDSSGHSASMCTISTVALLLI